MKKYLGVGILALTVVWPAFVSADSTFSTPAGAPSSSSGFSTPAGAASNGPVISSSGFSTPAGAAMNSTVRGEVTRVEGDSYFLRDTDGRELRVQPTKDARIDYTPHPGDRIEAQLSNGRATSVTRAPSMSSGAPSGGSSSSAGGSPSVGAGGGSSGGK